jgi:GNAT superfamily N-acetyltransferase
MIVIEERTPTPIEYVTLRRAVGWAVPDTAACERAISGTRGAVCALLEGVVVGMGRLVGDGSFYWLMVDVVVDPAHQGIGIGRRIVDALQTMVERGSSVGFVNLVAASDVAGFYERLGFEDTGSMFMMKRF